jgi:hypothetical protein
MTSTSTPCAASNLCTPFAESALWRMQSRYFEERGIDAWRRNEVPHHATNNPLIADAYARIVWACWHDRRAGTDHPSPMMICEIGAGSGGFAFHFIRRLLELCAESALAPSSVFRYVLTDFAKANVEVWQQHPCFSGWIAGGLLDMAHFDALTDTEMTLLVSGARLAPDTHHEPLIIIANYFFDSIPQELYHLNRGSVRRCRLTLKLDENQANLDAAEQLARMDYEYHYEDPSSEYFLQDKAIRTLVDDYKAALTDTHVLVPAAGWHCIERLTALSTEGILLLAADKGASTLAQLEGQPTPDIQRHGSISLPVNIHALHRLTTMHGGRGFVPADAHPDFVTFALLHTPHPERYATVGHVCKEYLDQVRPDDIFRLSAHLRSRVMEMTVRDILAYARTCRYDSLSFAFCLPGLISRASSMTDSERCALRDTLGKVWASHFPLGEELDLAYHLACLCYELDDYHSALLYFDRSVEWYGWSVGAAFNMAVCHRMLGNEQVARMLLENVLLHDSLNSEARNMLADIASL